MRTKPFDRRIFFSLWAASVLGVLTVLPYVLTLQAEVLESMPLPMPLAVLIPLQVLQNAILFGLVIWIGLWAANRTGLGLPILEAALTGEPVKQKIKAILLPSVVLGIITAAVIILLEVLLFNPLLAAQLGDGAAVLNLQGSQPSAWKGLLASFYGGINEEILLRLGLMSLLVWLGKGVAKAPDGHPAPIVFWVANLLAALAFGLGHLPATALLIPLTPLVIARAVVLNGLAGLGFGWLYWRRGLESAMLSHFSADLVLHVLLAL
jgi:membrane protease YdiL (CAAX protease family)